MARPQFEATKVMRRKVAAAAGGGMSHEEIALGLGIARGTLEKHFQSELSIGAYAKRVEVLDAMHRSATRGNVAAQKAYLALNPKASAPPQPTEPKKPAALGKKDQANVDAKDAAVGTEWSDLLDKPQTAIQ